MNTFNAKALTFIVTIISISSNYKLINPKFLFIEKSISIVINPLDQIGLQEKTDVLHNRENVKYNATGLQKITNNITDVHYSKKDCKSVNEIITGFYDIETDKMNDYCKIVKKVNSFDIKKNFIFSSNL